MATPPRTETRQPSGDRGVTLIELMIVLAILSVTSGAIFSIVLASYKTYWKGDAATQAQQGARVSVDRLVRDLRQAGQLINGVTETVGATSVTFNTSCAPAQVGMALPHVASLTLAPTATIFGTDAETSTMPHPGLIPYAGSYVSYYLASSPGSGTPNSAGPYLIRASYDLPGNTIALATVAGNITGFSLSAGGSCPTTSSREFTVQVTATQTQSGQGVSSQTTVVDDVTLRNSTLTY